MGPIHSVSDRAVPSSRRLRVGVYAYAVDDDERILLARLAPSEPRPGAWTLPGGGLHWGERPVDGLHRELHEETGLAGELEGLLIVETKIFPPHPRTGDRELHAIQMVYRMRVRGDPRVESDGSTDDVAWHPLASVDRLPTLSLVDVALSVGAARTPRY